MKISVKIFSWDGGLKDLLPELSSFNLQQEKNYLLGGITSEDLVWFIANYDVLTYMVDGEIFIHLDTQGRRCTLR